jgi:hypothetical protein
MNNQEILDKATSKVAVYNPIEQGIALMLEKHGHVLTTPPVVRDDPKALKAAKSNRMELVKFRTTLDDVRKSEKAESLAYGRLVDSEAKRIQAIADPIELAYSAVIDAEEKRLEAIRQEALELERQRVASHRARIQTIKDMREAANMARTVERVEYLLTRIPECMNETFEEFQGEALDTYREVSKHIEDMLAAKVEARDAAAELARQQVELAKQKAEADRIESERRAAAKLEADAQAAKLKREREAFEAEQAEVRRRQKIETDRIAAQQAELDAQQAAQRAIEEAKAAPIIEPPAAPVVVIVEVDDALVDFGPMRTPEAHELVQAVADKFNVPMFIAAEWIERRFDEIKELT